MSSIRAIVSAFEDAFAALHERDFRKTYRFDEWSERELNPAFRMYLLGRFAKVVCEYRLPSGGRIDFVVGKIAVEFAVARSGYGAGSLGSGANRTELAKLAEYAGPSLLVLLDFNESACFNRDTFRSRYRERWAGIEVKSPVNVAAIGWCDGQVSSDCFQLRTNKQTVLV